MGNVVLGMTLSLDGFVNDRNGSPSRLYSDFAKLQNTEMMRDSIDNTGAVLMGKRVYAMGDPDAYAEHYEYQVPIFVLTHTVPQKLPRQSDKLTFTFVTDGIESAIKQAKIAAGDKDVTVIGGASTAQQLINARLLDELQVDIMPVLLGRGLRLFEHLDEEQLKLEKLEVIESSARTHLGFRVVKEK